MNYGRYRCPECRGQGIVECKCCGNEELCETCKGRSYDPNQIDLDAYQAACQKLKRGADGCTYAYRDGKGHYVGRTNGVDTVLVKDFKRK